MSARPARIATLATLVVAVGLAFPGARAAGRAAVPDEELLTLVAPDSPTGNTLITRRPRFVWRSAAVASPPGPWSYDLRIVNVGTRQPLVVPRLADTTFVPAEDLASNTSYRWSVTARLTNGDSVTATSRATFVIVDPDAPPATLLYQNFPNPFPSATSASTCVWFDLRQTGLVRLDVYDLRGHHVRTIVGTELPAGRHGRAAVGAEGAGCDPRFTWDGAAADGRVVPPGVYLLRLRANGVESVRKIVFRGR